MLVQARVSSSPLLPSSTALAALLQKQTTPPQGTYVVMKASKLQKHRVERRRIKLHQKLVSISGEATWVPVHGVFLPYLLVLKQHLCHPLADFFQSVATVTCFQLSGNNHGTH